MPEESFQRVGDYEILGVLGAGGMGKVFKVRNVISDRIEAMKILLPDLAGRHELAERFLREIKLLASLNHPNIAALRTALTWNNQLVMIMEYVEGVTLATRLKQGPVSTSEAVQYIDQVLAALSYAHRLHVIHRDITPANMMVTPDNVVKLMDFGIARSRSDPILTATGSTLGSLHYMSPEQVRGEQADERSDLYSVGVSLYELVSGHRPFEAESDLAILTAQLQKPPAPPITLRKDLPAALNDIILLSLNKDPAQRFQTADAFRRALTAVPTSLPAVAPGDQGAAVVGGESTVTCITPPNEVIKAAATASAAVLPVMAPQAPDAPASPALGPQGPAPASPVPNTSMGAQPPAGSVTPAPARASRGLYITLGALIVVLVLVAAGLYLPRVRRAHAGAEPRTAVTQPPNLKAANPQPASVSDVTPAAPQLASGARSNPPPAAVTPKAEAGAPQVTDAGRGGKILSGSSTKRAIRVAASETKVGSGPTALSSEKSTAAKDISPAGASESAEELPHLEHDMDLLLARADTVDASLNGMRQNQAAQGLSMRGDVAASQQRMRTYLDKAQSALKNQDASKAKKYLDLAETEVATLEKFLGR